MVVIDFSNKNCKKLRVSNFQRIKYLMINFNENKHSRKRKRFVSIQTINIQQVNKLLRQSKTITNRILKIY